VDVHHEAGVDSEPPWHEATEKPPDDLFPGPAAFTGMIDVVSQRELLNDLGWSPRTMPATGPGGFGKGTNQTLPRALLRLLPGLDDVVRRSAVGLVDPEGSSNRPGRSAECPQRRTAGTTGDVTWFLAGRSSYGLAGVALATEQLSPASDMGPP